MRLMKYLLAVLFFLLFINCASYYQKNLQFQEYYVKNEIEQAAKVLDNNKKAAKGKNRLLYFLQKGTVLQLMDKYAESNQSFEDAYLFIEDYQKSYANQAASLISNPMVTPYRGEDFEVVQIHYFKAINYMMLKQYEEALVECRRINIKLNQLNDKYERRKNCYKVDAFAQNLMGMIFEATKDYNNAFISYRNAYEAYEQVYKPCFGVDVPQQLKIDLLRTAYLNGFTNELQNYEQSFNLKYVHNEREFGELVLFWNNGLGPVKDEWSINFFIVKGQGGIVTFVNEEYGLSFPFPIGGNSGASANFADIKFIRVAFPKYLERKPYYRTAVLKLDKSSLDFELAQDINNIAIETLKDRMVREFMTSLLRLALKQSAEQSLRKKNANLGALLSIANAVSEKADTRNWQTLPYSISYVRVPLNSGENTVALNFSSPRKSQTFSEKLAFDGLKGETQFFLYYTLDSIPIGQ